MDQDLLKDFCESSHQLEQLIQLYVSTFQRYDRAIRPGLQDLDRLRPHRIQEMAKALIEQGGHNALQSAITKIALTDAYQNLLKEEQEAAAKEIEAQKQEAQKKEQEALMDDLDWDLPK